MLKIAEVSFVSLCRFLPPHVNGRALKTQLLLFLSMSRFTKWYNMYQLLNLTQLKHGSYFAEKRVWQVYDFMLFHENTTHTKNRNLGVVICNNRGTVVQWLGQIPPMRVRFLMLAWKNGCWPLLPDSIDVQMSINWGSLYHCTLCANKRSLKVGKCVGRVRKTVFLKCQNQYLYSRLTLVKS